MSFGAEILFILLLGLLVLGPKRLHTVLADVARAKARRLPPRFVRSDYQMPTSGRQSTMIPAVSQGTNARCSRYSI